ncbi:MAG: hypothetical protein HY982_01005 [Candidatus Magasanikbacteria bacterium]|nr:hypothetical protein [Candidatus Magasanikbacteria bacterium]
MKKYHSSDTTGWWVAGGITMFTALILFLMFRSVTPSDYSKKSTRELALLCTRDTATKFHIHADLKITINGENETIPANVGILPTCMNSLHTHDTRGTLHVEAPAERDFTLGDFFAVWQKSFTNNRVLDATVDADHVIRVSVNGKKVSTFETTVLHDDDQIVISYEEKNDTSFVTSTN